MACATASTSPKQCIPRATHSAYLERNPVDIVVAHVHLEVSGLELVSRLRDRQSETLGIVVTSHGSMETAISAIRAGAYDYISKPVTLAALEVAVARDRIPSASPRSRSFG